MPLRAQRPQLRHGRMLMISSPPFQTPFRITIAITAQDLRKVTLLCCCCRQWRTERWRCGLSLVVQAHLAAVLHSATAAAAGSRAGCVGVVDAVGIHGRPTSSPPTQTSRSLACRWASMFGLAPPCRKVCPTFLRLDPAKFPAIIHFDWVRRPCEFLKPSLPHHGSSAATGTFRALS